MTEMTFNDNFPPVSKAQWLEQISKDLKGRPLEELNWHLPDGLIVTPFVHADDFPHPVAPLATTPNSWEICEDIMITDPVAANRQALEALEGGAEGLRFWLDQALSFESMEALLEGIYPDFIGLHFAGPGLEENPGAILGHLGRLAQKRGIPAGNLRGSMAYNPVPGSKLVDWRYLADLVVFAQEQFPNFSLISLPVSDALEDGLQQANLYLEKLSEKGIPLAVIASKLQFSVQIGKRYFLEIARLRALRLLWYNVLKAWNAPLSEPRIEAHFQPEAYTDELYTNMIRGTTMAMSAVIGGANTLTVRPYDAGREEKSSYPQAFSRRIARNVQHLLKMESALDEIPDPAAGSYYIETLTQQVARHAWEAFKQKGQDMR